MQVIHSSSLKKMKNTGQPLLILLICPFLTFGYPNGAPSEACEDMTPQHGVEGIFQQSHHQLLIGKRSYNFRLGEKIDISLIVPSNRMRKFKGFLIMVSKVKAIS